MELRRFWFLMKVFFFSSPSCTELPPFSISKPKSNLIKNLPCLCCFICSPLLNIQTFDCKIFGGILCSFLCAPLERLREGFVPKRTMYDPDLTYEPSHDTEIQSYLGQARSSGSQTTPITIFWGNLRSLFCPSQDRKTKISQIKLVLDVSRQC